MKVSAVKLPPCGLYRTTRPHPSAPEIGSGILVNVHTCDRAVAGPQVHLPKFNAFNQWEWCREGHVVEQLTWLETLVPLLPEGFYRLLEDIELGESKWPDRSLVQLGYDLGGMPIVFLAQRKHHLAENTLTFASKGIPLPDDRLSILAPLVIHDEPDPNAAGGHAEHAT